MKKIYVFSCMMLLLAFGAFAQDDDMDVSTGKSNVGNSQWTLALRADFYDFYTPVWNDIDDAVVDSLGLKKPWYYGPSLTVWKNFGSSIAISADFGFADIKVGKTKDALLPAHNKHVLNFGGGLVYKFNNGYIFDEDAVVAPYIFGKVFGNLIKDAAQEGKKDLTANVPVGLGLNFRVANEFALQLQAAYSFGITDLAEDNIQAGIGFAWDVNRVKREKTPEVLPEPVVVITDTDNDGIADENDECPTIAGSAELNGCPDSDGDGVADNKDDCPLVAGLERFAGCPDSDGDGFSDNKDKCPYQAGVAAREGCPNPDSDGDGVLDDVDQCPTVAGLSTMNGCPDTDADGLRDSQDKCPTVAGPASNQGCPEIKEEVKKRLAWAAANILFESGKAILKASSNKVLDEVASILKEYPDYNVSVEGHTDSQGDEAMNQSLSEARAKAAMDYLISKGIPASRITSKGFGETKPIATNDTAAGRQQNRRVEFNLSLR